jgi:DNA-binding NarL/FixJ family response regulator
MISLQTFHWKALTREQSNLEVTDVAHAGQELRTPSDAGQPSFGNRWRLPQRAELAESRDAMTCVRVDPVIRTFSRLTANGDNGVSKRNAGVTSEELSILTLMAEGLTLDSVAVRVAMSPRTLSRRLRCVCDRLGVAHPIQAIVWAAHQGLI